jgi:hypothetical protein
MLDLVKRSSLLSQGESYGFECFMALILAKRCHDIMHYDLQHNDSQNIDTRLQIKSARMTLSISLRIQHSNKNVTRSINDT